MLKFRLFGGIMTAISGYVLLTLILGECLNMNVGLWVTIIAVAIGALLSGFGTIAGWLNQSKLLKRDSEKINDIDDNSIYIKPKVDNIDENTKFTRNEITKEVLPKVNKLEKMEDAISKLTLNLEIQNAIKSKVSDGLRKDETVQQVASVFEINAKLNEELISQEIKIGELQTEVSNLKMNNREISSEKQNLEMQSKKTINRLQNKIASLEHKLEPDNDLSDEMDF